MSPNKVETLYRQAIDFKEALQNALNQVNSCNWHQVFKQFIRYAVLDILSQDYSEGNFRDYKHFVLYHHYDNNQLSRRDIATYGKEMMTPLDDEEKKELIKKAIDRVASLLKKITITDARQQIKLTLADKQRAYDKAIGDNIEEVILKKLETFNQNTLKHFAKTFNIQLRNQDEKFEGRSYRKKQKRNREKHNGEMWSDPETKKKMRKALKRGWKKRRNGENKKAKKTSKTKPEGSPEISGEELIGKILEHMKMAQARSWHHFEKPIKNLFQEITKTNGREVTLGDLCNYFVNGEGQAFWEKGKEPKFALLIKGYLCKEGLIHKDELSDYGLTYNQIN